MKILVFLFFLIGIYFNSFGQSSKELNELFALYEEFEFERVIELTDQIIINAVQDSTKISEDVFTLQAASYFALNELDNSRKAFIKLLNQNKDYILSDVRFSPKIINFYNSIKDEYYSILVNQNEDKLRSENTSENILNENIYFDYSQFKSAIVKSALIPGWGHIHVGDHTKGWVLSSVSTLTLGSMIYYIFDTKKKEELYLNATNSGDIRANYNSYNSSYKIRNALIITYAAVWLYSQIDILFFNNSFDNNISIFQNYQSSPQKEIIHLSINIPL